MEAVAAEARRSPRRCIADEFFMFSGGDGCLGYDSAGLEMELGVLRELMDEEAGGGEEGGVLLVKGKGEQE